ncbi:uncharacterized protein RAG0_09220 [Rhynchosporium agropyri]|uniref:Uncharacterized protein n=1 Tax=Rhynchosporium agropyri TaxID=914238 RepID=A0A1E1KXA8_9HELO|nr:uncharacterized protein RAG0_09220 [Rhynchosporium agropyri]
MGDSSVAICPFRTQIHDPSAIQTEPYEVQTQKFELQVQKYELQPPQRFEIQVSRYEEPVNFTGTSKDLELLARCQKGHAFEYQLEGDSDNDSIQQDYNESDQISHEHPTELGIEDEGQERKDSKDDDDTGTSKAGEASISQPVATEIVEDLPGGASSVPPAAPNPPGQDDDIQEHSAKDVVPRDISGSTDTVRSTSPNSVHFADEVDIAPPASELKSILKNNNKQSRKEAKKEKKQEKRAKQFEKEPEPEKSSVIAEVEDDLPKSSKKGKDSKKEKKQDKKSKQADKGLETEKPLEPEKAEDDSPKHGKKGKKGKKADKSWEPEPTVEKEKEVKPEKAEKQEKGGKGKKDRKGGKGKEKAGKMLIGAAVVGAAAAIAIPALDDSPSESPGDRVTSPNDDISPASDPAPSNDLPSVSPGDSILTPIEDSLPVSDSVPSNESPSDRPGEGISSPVNDSPPASDLVPLNDLPSDSPSDSVPNPTEDSSPASDLVPSKDSLSDSPGKDIPTPADSSSASNPAPLTNEQTLDAASHLQDPLAETEEIPIDLQPRSEPLPSSDEPISEATVEETSTPVQQASESVVAESPALAVEEPVPTPPVEEAAALAVEDETQAPIVDEVSVPIVEDVPAPLVEETSPVEDKPAPLGESLPVIEEKTTPAEKQCSLTPSPDDAPASTEKEPDIEASNEVSTPIVEELSPETLAKDLPVVDDSVMPHEEIGSSKPVVEEPKLSVDEDIPAAIEETKENLSSPSDGDSAVAIVEDLPLDEPEQLKEEESSPPVTEELPTSADPDQTPETAETSIEPSKSSLVEETVHEPANETSDLVVEKAPPAAVEETVTALESTNEVIAEGSKVTEEGSNLNADTTTEPDTEVTTEPLAEVISAPSAIDQDAEEKDDETSQPASEAPQIEADNAILEIGEVDKSPAAIELVVDHEEPVSASNDSERVSDSSSSDEVVPQAPQPEEVADANGLGLKNESEPVVKNEGVASETASQSPAVEAPIEAAVETLEAKVDKEVVAAQVPAIATELAVEVVDETSGPSDDEPTSQADETSEPESLSEPSQEQAGTPSTEVDHTATENLDEMSKDQESISDVSSVEQTLEEKVDIPLDVSEDKQKEVDDAQSTSEALPVEADSIIKKVEQEDASPAQPEPIVNLEPVSTPDDSNTGASDGVEDTPAVEANDGLRDSKNEPESVIEIVSPTIPGKAEPAVHIKSPSIAEDPSELIEMESQKIIAESTIVAVPIEDCALGEKDESSDLFSEPQAEPISGEPVSLSSDDAIEPAKAETCEDQSRELAISDEKPVSVTNQSIEEGLTLEAASTIIDDANDDTTASDEALTAPEAEKVEEPLIVVESKEAVSDIAQEIPAILDVAVAARSPGEESSDESGGKDNESLESSTKEIINETSSEPSEPVFDDPAPDESKGEDNDSLEPSTIEIKELVNETSPELPEPGVEIKDDPSAVESEGKDHKSLKPSTTETKELADETSSESSGPIIETKDDPSPVENEGKEHESLELSTIEIKELVDETSSEPSEPTVEIKDDPAPDETLAVESKVQDGNSEDEQPLTVSEATTAEDLEEDTKLDEPELPTPVPTNEELGETGPKNQASNESEMVDSLPSSEKTETSEPKALEVEAASETNDIEANDEVPEAVQNLTPKVAENKELDSVPEQTRDLGLEPGLDVIPVVSETKESDSIPEETKDLELAPPFDSSPDVSETKEPDPVTDETKDLDPEPQNLADGAPQVGEPLQEVEKPVAAEAPTFEPKDPEPEVVESQTPVVELKESEPEPVISLEPQIPTAEPRESEPEVNVESQIPNFEPKESEPEVVESQTTDGPNDRDPEVNVESQTPIVEPKQSEPETTIEENKEPEPEPASPSPPQNEEVSKETVVEEGGESKESSALDDALPIVAGAAAAVAVGVIAAEILSDDKPMTDKAIVEEPEQLPQVVEEPGPGELPSSPKSDKERRRHRSSRHSRSSHHSSSSKDVPREERSSHHSSSSKDVPREERPHHKRRETEPPPITSPKSSPRSVKPTRHDSGVSTGRTSSPRHRKDRTPEEQAAHDKRKEEKRARLRAAEAELTKSKPLDSTVIEEGDETPMPAIPRRISSSRRHSSTKSATSNGSTADGGDKRPNLLGLKGISVVKSPFVATDKAHVKEVVEKTTKAPIIDRPRFSTDHERPKLSRRETTSHHTRSHRREREREESDNRVEEERKARKSRRESDKGLATARADVAEEARKMQEKEDEERRIRREERRLRRAQTEAAGKSSEGGGKTSERSAEKGKERESIGRDGEAVRSKERVHRHRHRREKEKEREEKPKGALKGLFSSMRKVFN